MKIAQLVDNVVHYIFEADEIPVFAPNIIMVDITNISDVEVGMLYDFETNTFSVYTKTEDVVQPTNAELQALLAETQTNQIIIMEVLATMYEEFLADTEATS
ncbi:hypothetical protein Q5O14_18010 [Eubacteriaceae bacterium ES2]|nr:hypothetical protein Q5O14_18010 [Eubacteriaceae bacterium ES2]